MIKVAATVILYNPTKNDIKNIYSYAKTVEVIYVIDNSKNSNYDLLSSIPTKIEYIHKSENVGMATALNIAASMAIENGYKWLLTMDQDSKFSDNTFEEYLELAFSQNLDNIGLVSPWHNTSYNVDKPSIQFEKVKDVMTSGNLLNIEIYQNVGEFLDWLFIDGVDTEYCLRLKKNKFQILRINSIIFEHSLGDYSKHNFLWKKDIETTNHNYIRRYYIARNNLYLKQLYYDLDPEWLDEISKLSHVYKRVLLFEKDKIRKIRALNQGRRDFKNGIKGKKEFDY